MAINAGQVIIISRWDYIQSVLKVASSRLYSRSREKVLYLQPNANYADTPITQQLTEIGANVTTMLPPVANKTQAR
jgi:hypothetical protein